MQILTGTSAYSRAVITRTGRSMTTSARDRPVSVPLFHHGTTIKYEYLHTKHIAWVHTAYNSSKTKSILITI